MSLKTIYEDARDAGYPHELVTPRPLGPKDYQFVAMNAGRKVGQTVLRFDGIPIEGSYILQSNARMFQYSHTETEEQEIHIESVETYRNLWNSIHIPEHTSRYV